MATRSREDSDIDPLEDEMEFTKAMRLAGFKKQLNFQMPLTVPAEEFLDGTPIDRLKVFLLFLSFFKFWYPMNSLFHAYLHANEVDEPAAVGFLHEGPIDGLG